MSKKENQDAYQLKNLPAYSQPLLCDTPPWLYQDRIDYEG